MLVAALFLWGCGSEPGEAVGSDVGVVDGGLPDGLESGCEVPVITEGPSYTPHPSWGTTRAIAVDGGVFAAIPLQGDAEPSHWIQTFGEISVTDLPLLEGQLELISAAGTGALVLRRTFEGDESLVEVRTDGTTRELATDFGSLPNRDRMYWESISPPIWAYDGLRATWTGPLGEVMYAAGDAQMVVTGPAGIAPHALELSVDGLIASVRPSDEPGAPSSLFEWTPEGDWVEIALGVSGPIWPDATDGAVFWTQEDGVYRSNLSGEAERIFEGACGPVDAFAGRAVFGCFGEPGEAPPEPGWHSESHSLWVYSDGGLERVPTEGGFLIAWRGHGESIAWIEYPADDVQTMCQGGLTGSVFVAALDQGVACAIEAVGTVGSGCGCCAFSGTSLQFSLSSSHVVWNYAPPDPDFSAPGWEAVRYRLLRDR